jgi:hypothetical protein
VEPNFWLDFGAWGVGMMASRNGRPAVPVHLEHDDEDEKDITLGQFLKRWGHASVTVTLGIFLFTQWKESGVERANMERQIAINTATIARLIQDNRDQDEQTRILIANVQRAGEVQRADIREIQREIVDHFATDDRRFRRAGVNEK